MWWRLGTQRVCLKFMLFDLPAPVINQLENILHDDSVMRGRIFFEISSGHAHELVGRMQARASRGPFGVFVHGQMHKSAGQLNERLIKIRIWLPARFQPQILQHIMRLVKLAGIEAFKVAKITRIMLPTGPMRHAF